MSELTTTKPNNGVISIANNDQVYVTVYIENQLFGIPIDRVQDILVTEDIAMVPLSPSEVAGVINLRGRIVTVIDVRKKLGLPAIDEKKKMCVTVEKGHELYSLMVNSVGSVLSIPIDTLEPQPNTLDSRWSSVCLGVVRLENEIMIVLDVDTLLAIK